VPDIAVGDVYRFALEQQALGNQIVNTFAFRVKENPVPISVDGFLTGLFDGAGAEMAVRLSAPIGNLQNQIVSHLRWRVQKVSPVPEAVREYFPNTTGILENEVDTLNIAACITRFGAGAGRRQRGRIAIGGLDESLYKDGRFSIATMIALNTFKPNLYIDVVAPLSVYTLEMGFWSPAHTGTVDGEPVSYAAQFVPCVGAVVRETVRTQRSRTLEVGS